MGEGGGGKGRGNGGREEVVVGGRSSSWVGGHRRPWVLAVRWWGVVSVGARTHRCRAHGYCARGGRGRARCGC